MNYEHYMDGAKDDELIADLRCEIERLTEENKKMVDQHQGMVWQAAIERLETENEKLRAMLHRENVKYLDLIQEWVKLAMRARPIIDDTGIEYEITKTWLHDCDRLRELTKRELDI